MGGGKWGVGVLWVQTQVWLSVWGDQKFLEMDGDDNCITM